MGRVQNVSKLISKIRLIRGLTACIAFAFFASGCNEAQLRSLDQSDRDDDQNIDDSVQINPLFVCGQGSMITGFSKEGQPVCDSSCDGAGCTESAKSVAFGITPAQDFECPQGSFFSGIDEEGRAICNEPASQDPKAQESGQWISLDVIVSNRRFIGKRCPHGEYAIGFLRSRFICASNW